MLRRYIPTDAKMAIRLLSEEAQADVELINTFLEIIFMIAGFVAFACGVVHYSLILKAFIQVARGRATENDLRRVEDGVQGSPTAKNFGHAAQDGLEDRGRAEQSQRLGHVLEPPSHSPEA